MEGWAVLNALQPFESVSAFGEGKTQWTGVIVKDDGAHILVIDDESSIGRSSQTLSELGYKVSSAISSTMAIEALREQEVDVVLTSSSLAEGGSDLISHIVNELHPDVVCVEMSDERPSGTSTIWSLRKPLQVEEARTLLVQALTLRELRRDNRRLTERIHECVAELECRDEELSLFHLAMSHDLRAPINRIAGFSAILTRTASDLLDEESRECLAYIDSSVNDFNNLIDGLRSMVSVGCLKPQIEALDMTMLAHTAAYRLYHTTPFKSAKVEIQEGMSAWADERLMTIVVTNLLSNSLKFTSEVEAPQIVVGRLSDPPLFPFFVRDNGVGFNPEYGMKLFEPFKRLHTGTHLTGSGIGLTAVDRIIRRHGGKVWAESELGQGATFYFTLPHLEDQESMNLLKQNP